MKGVQGVDLTRTGSWRFQEGRVGGRRPSDMAAFPAVLGLRVISQLRGAGKTLVSPDTPPTHTHQQKPPPRWEGD